MRTCGGRKQPNLNDMAAEGIFHLNVKRGSRAENRLAVDKHDYIMRLGRFAKSHDGELAFAESGNMPSWAKDDPRKFWVAVDAHERANATLYHEEEFALPLALSLKQQIEAAREQVHQVCGDEHPYSWGLHFKEGNPHVHLEFSGRKLDGIERDADQFFKRYNAKNPERGGCRKESSGDARGPEWVKQTRKDWEEIANRHLAAAGHDIRIDCRSHEARGLDEAPGVHLGRRATRLEQRGKNTWRGLKNREAQHRNASLQEVRSNIQQKENEHGQQHPGRNGKPQQQPHHHRRRGDDHAAPERAFTAWRDRAEDRQGLRTSRRAGPERMPTLRQSSPGDGFQEARNAVLQRTVQGSGRGHHGVHGLPAGGLYVHESLDRRQQYKRQILTERYNTQISDELAGRLLYVDRQSDQVVITLRGYAGAAGGRVIDKGDRMAANRGNNTEILALIYLARTKCWKQIQITGTEAFKARAYLEATRAGLAVIGYEPSPEIRAQLQKEKKTMLGQAGADGMMALTPDLDVSTEKASPASRWLDPLRSAREKLDIERRIAKERLAVLQETDLKNLERDLAAEYGGAEYREAVQDFRSAAAAAKDAGVFSRMRAEARKEKTWRFLQVAHSKALGTPAAAARLNEATTHNQERARLMAALTPLQLGVGEIDCLVHEIKNRGHDPEPEFAQAWQRRKIFPLKPWQTHALTPVFEADAARERARLKAEADDANQSKQAQRQEQIQRELAAQRRADAIQDQLTQPGLTAEKEETLERQQRYYLALADGHSEEEAKERATLKKANAPRP